MGSEIELLDDIVVVDEATSTFTSWMSWPSRVWISAIWLWIDAIVADVGGVGVDVTPATGFERSRMTLA